MNTTFKRSVAAFLTAGMLLTGLTACFKSPEEKRGDEITELANQESEIKFDKILHINVSGKYSSEKTLLITGLINSNNIKNSQENYRELEYIISKEEYEAVYAIKNAADIYYPFDESSTELINNIIKSYEPERAGEIIDAPDSFFDKLDIIVEEYCK